MKHRSLLRYWMVGCALGLLGGELALLALQRLDLQADMISGWAISAILHGLGLLVVERSMARGGFSHPLGGLVAIIIRLFALIISVLIVLVVALYDVTAYVAGLLPAYFAGSWREIAWLRTRS